MNVLLIRSENFNTHEVMHTDPETLTDSKAPIAYYVMARIQSFRNFVSQKHNRDIRIIVTSGNRNPNHNASEGGVDNSYHIWRYDNEGQMIWALDIKSPDLDLAQLYEDAVAFFQGEVYWNTAQKIVHVSDYGPKESWIS